MHEKNHRVNLMPTYSTSLLVSVTFSFRELSLIRSYNSDALGYSLNSHQSQNHNTLLPQHFEKPSFYVALKKFVKLHIEVYYRSVKGIARAVENDVKIVAIINSRRLKTNLSTIFKQI